MKMRDIHKEEGRMVVSTAYDKLRQSMDVVCIVHHPGIVATLEIIEDDMVDDFYVGALPHRCTCSVCRDCCCDLPRHILSRCKCLVVSPCFLVRRAI